MNDLENKDNSNSKKIKLYPFNGRSPYLIDKFYIIGYNYLTLHKLLIENNPINIEEQKDIYQFTLDEEPSILNEIVSDYKKVGLPNEIILKMIFPKPLIFYAYKTHSPIKKYSNNYCKIDFKDKQNLPKRYKVFFSSNPQADNNSKKSINGFALVFYRKFSENKKIDNNKYIYYIPYTFCIISEFPYFNSFNELCKFIKNFFAKDEILLPIEFLISNIVTLTPSPIKSDVILDLNSLNERNISMDKINLRYSKKDITITHLNTLYGSNNEGLNINRNKEFGSIRPSYENRIMTKCQINTFSNLSSNNISVDKSNKKNLRKITFEYLSGYPLIQYNLSNVLFYTLTPDKIITIFLYTFLEKDVLFFSNNIEFLTLTINAYINLNFPLNDEKYYFIGTAISFEDFSFGNSEFGVKSYTSIIGINDQFRQDYKNKQLKIKDHLAIDLDKGEIYHGLDENDNNVNESNQKLTKLIKKLYDEKEDSKNPGNILYQSIKNLCSSLKKIYETNEIKNDLNSKDNFNPLFGNTILKKYIESNKEIQEIFYKFIHNICLYFYDNLSIKDEKEKNYIVKNKKTENKISINYNKESAFEKAKTDEEKFFLIYLKFHLLLLKNIYPYILRKKNFFFQKKTKYHFLI